MLSVIEISKSCLDEQKIYSNRLKDKNLSDIDLP